MKLSDTEPKKPYLTTKPSDKTFETQVKRDVLGQELQETLSDTNVLFIPDQGYMDELDLLYFPVGTSDLYQFVIDQNIEGLKVEICSEESDYKELALHADWLIITEFIVKEVVAPLFVALLAEYIIKKVGSKKDETIVKSKFTMTDEKEKKHIEFQYEGPAKEYRSVMLNAIAKNSSKTLPTHVEIKPKRQHHKKK